MDEMNDLVSLGRKPPNVMNSSRLRTISMILSRVPMSPNAMNKSGLWMKFKPISHEVRALESINSSKLWIP